MTTSEIDVVGVWNHLLAGSSLAVKLNVRKVKKTITQFTRTPPRVQSSQCFGLVTKCSVARRFYFKTLTGRDTVRLAQEISELWWQYFNEMGMLFDSDDSDVFDTFDLAISSLQTRSMITEEVLNLL